MVKEFGILKNIAANKVKWIDEGKMEKDIWTESKGRLLLKFHRIEKNYYSNWILTL